MFYMTVFAHETAMATTELTRIACNEFCTPRKVEQKAERTALRMSWVVVTDEHGNPGLRSVWNVAKAESEWSKNGDETELSQIVDEGRAVA